MGDAEDDCDQLMRDIDSLIGHTKSATAEPTFKVPHSPDKASAHQSDENDENDWDVSLSLSDVDVTSPIQQRSQPPAKFITPPNAKKPRQIATLSPFSPMPSYEKMSDERLRAALRGFGLRDKMSRKRMLAALEKIYTETHQYETDTDLESNTPDKQIYHNHKTSFHLERSHKPSAISSLATHDNAPESRSSESDSDSSANDLMKGEGSDDDGVVSLTQTNTVDDNLYKIFGTDEKFRTRMLTYEPIPIEELVELVKSQGIKCSSKSVSKWCFDKCIQLSMKGQHKRNDKQKQTRTKKPTKKKTTSKSSQPVTNS